MKENNAIGSKLVQGLEEFASALESRSLKSMSVRTVVLDLEPTSYDSDLVRRTRKELGLSQSLFAKFLGVSTSTVQSWEQGDKHPQGIACRFMDEIRYNKDYWRARLQDSVVKKT